MLSILLKQNKRQRFFFFLITQAFPSERKQIPLSLLRPNACRNRWIRGSSRTRIVWGEQWTWAPRTVKPSVVRHFNPYLASCIPLHETMKTLGERYFNKKMCWVGIIISKPLCSKFHLWLHFGQKSHTALSKGAAHVLVSPQLLPEACEPCHWEQGWPLALPGEAQGLEGAVLYPAAHREVLLVACVSVLPLVSPNVPGQSGWGAVALWIM